MAIVLAKETGEGGGNLRLPNGSGEGALAEWRRVRPDDRNPDVFGAFLIRAMIFPFHESAATAVIGGDNKSRLATIKGNGLHGVPELVDKVVDFVGAVKDEVIAAGVRPIVGFAVADEENLGMIRTDEVEQGNLL